MSSRLPAEELKLQWEKKAKKAQKTESKTTDEQELPTKPTAGAAWYEKGLIRLPMSPDSQLQASAQGSQAESRTPTPTSPNVSQFKPDPKKVKPRRKHSEETHKRRPRLKLSPVESSGASQNGDKSAEDQNSAVIINPKSPERDVVNLLSHGQAREGRSKTPTPLPSPITSPKATTKPNHLQNATVLPGMGRAASSGRLSRGMPNHSNRRTFSDAAIGLGHGQFSSDTFGASAVSAAASVSSVSVSSASSSSSSSSSSASKTVGTSSVDLTVEIPDDPYAKHESKSKRDETKTKRDVSRRPQHNPQEQESKDTKESKAENERPKQPNKRKRDWLDSTHGSTSSWGSRVVQQQTTQSAQSASTAPTVPTVPTVPTAQAAPRMNSRPVAKPPAMMFSDAAIAAAGNAGSSSTSSTKAYAPKMSDGNDSDQVKHQAKRRKKS